MVGPELLNWLEAKQAAGVKSVQVNTVIRMLREEMDEVLRSRATAGLPKDGKVTIRPSDLLGASEVAEYLGVDRTRPSKWRGMKTRFGPEGVLFPRYYVKLSTGPVWLKSQVEPFIEFVEARRRNHR